jgi:hypothetical protein
MRVRYGLSAPEYAALGLVRLAKGMRLGRFADGLSWRPNAPRQPRRWQRCGARRVAARGSCQTRAQVRGRASGVVLHAVVRPPNRYERSIIAPLCGISHTKWFTLFAVSSRHFRLARWFLSALPARVMRAKDGVLPLEYAEFQVGEMKYRACELSSFSLRHSGPARSFLGCSKRATSRPKKALFRFCMRYFRLRRCVLDALPRARYARKGQSYSASVCGLSGWQKVERLLASCGGAASGGLTFRFTCAAGSSVERDGDREERTSKVAPRSRAAPAASACKRLLGL